MKKKLLFSGLFLFVAVFMLTGCSLTKITAEEFKSKAKNEELTVSDVTSSYSYLGYINKLYIAKHSSGWKVEFYEISTEDKAKTIYETNKTKFETAKSTGSSSTESLLSLDNGERYSLTVGGYYKHICRIDNTFVYANVKAEYKEDAIKFLKKIGY